MQPALFCVKRCHWSVVARTHDMLRPHVNLTSARFDMLRVIAMHDDGMAQGRLVDLLGVSGATVSRMLGSLEVLGLVKRARGHADDMRRNHITMTAAGFDALRIAMRVTIDNGFARHLAGCAITANPRADDEEESVGRAVAAFEKRLMGFRWICLDRTTVKHPWTTDPIPLSFFSISPSGRREFDASPSPN